MQDPYYPWYNCSSEPFSSVWQYNASSSPAERQSLSYRLQNAMCVHFIGTSSCPAKGPAPFEQSLSFKEKFSDFATAANRAFCDTYHIDEVSALLYTIFGTPAFAVFLVNTVVLALHFARNRRSRTVGTAQEAAAANRSAGSVLGGLDAIEMVLNVPRSSDDNRSTPMQQQPSSINAASTNLYGAFDLVLSLCCLRWTVGASHERWRQVSRAFFSAFFICSTAIICRSSFAVFSDLVESSAVAAFVYQLYCYTMFDNQWLYFEYPWY